VGNAWQLKPLSKPQIIGIDYIHIIPLPLPSHCPANCPLSQAGTAPHQTRPANSSGQLCGVSGLPAHPASATGSGLIALSAQ